ncbi:hypothetical protein HY249_01710, partial [Candidatus Azambacteria bacterium]|nr:hypothetical protein [Candidatus Azambacteria bacterium]
EKIEKAEPVIPVEAKPEVAKIPIRPVPAPKERKLEFEEVRMAQRPEEKQEQRSKEAENIPYIRPVVPLPTFMQSQFQPRKRPESAYQEKVSEEELKPKPPTEKKLAPKISGNVIDLRDL